MAARFWVGGTGNWSDITHWATVSGGAGGAAVPTSADDVTFDAASGGGALTVDVAAVCLSLTMTAFTGSVTMNQTITPSGSVILPSSAITFGGIRGFVPSPAAGVAVTFTSNGCTINGLTVQGASSTSKVTLQGNLITGSLALSSGILDTNSVTVTAVSFASSNSTVRTLTLGSSLIILSSGTATAADFTTVTNLVITLNTAIFRFTGVSGGLTTATKDFNGLSLEFNGGGTTMGIFGTGQGIFKNFTVTGTIAKTDGFAFAQPTTFIGTVTFQGNSQSARLKVFTNAGLGQGSSGTTNTITINGVHGAHQYVDFQDITIAGTAGSLTGTLIGDALGNSGITFTVAATQSWVGTAGGNWSDPTKWTSRVPLPQDDVTITSAFIATQTVTADMPRLCRNLSLVGSTGNVTLTISVSGAAIFGNLTLRSGMTFNGSTMNVQGRGAQTITTAGITMAPIAVIAPGGTYTLQDNYTTANNVGVFSGTFNANGFNITAPGISFNSSVARTINFGSGTWTLTGTANIFNNAGANSSVVAGTATIVISDTSVSGKTFAGNGLTYPTLRYIVAGSGPLTITGSNTFAGLDLRVGSVARTITLPANGIQTINGPLTLQGLTGQLLSFVSSTPGTSTTLRTTGSLTYSFISLSADVIIQAQKTGGGIGPGKSGTTKTVTAAKIGGAITLPDLALTITGNPITDAERWNKLSGDGLPIGTGLGAWEGTTQLVGRTNDLNHSDWGSYFVKPVFGTGYSDPFGGNNAFRMSSLIGGSGTLNVAGVTQVVGTGATGSMATGTYSVSVYLKSAPGTSQSVTYGLKDSHSVVITVDDVWRRYTLTTTYNGGEIQERYFQFFSSISQTMPDLYIFAPQTELKPYATPFYPNTGARGTTAVRVSSRVEAPPSLLNNIQGCIVARVRAGSTQTVGYAVGAGPTVAAFSQVSPLTEGFQIYYRAGSADWRLRAWHSGASAGDALISKAVAEGTYSTIVAYWTQTQVAISVDGGAFNIVTPTTMPALTSPSFNIGHHGNALPLNGSLVWLMAMSNIPSTADVATINSYGNTLPDIRSLPVAWGITGIWRAYKNATFMEVLPQGRASKASTAAKTAGAVSTLRPGTIKASIVGKVGGALIVNSAGGTENKFVAVGKIGGAKTELWSGVTSHRLLNVKTGGLVNAVVVGGTFRALKIKSGGSIAISLVGGSYRAFAVHTGGGQTSALTGAQRVIRWVKGGGSAGISRAGANYRILLLKTAGGKSVLIASATRYLTINRVGGSESSSNAGATKASFLQFSKAGGSFSTLTSGTTKALLITKYSGAIVSGKGGGYLIFVSHPENQWLLSVDLGQATLIDASEKTPVLLGAEEELADLLVGRLDTPVLKKVRVR